VLKRRDDLKTEPFAPDSGSDERQYCSQGFNLPISVIMRSRHGRYPEYHTSDDNKDLMDFDAMVDTINTLEEVVNVLERNRTYQTLKPFCEPHLEKYGLYDIEGPRDAGVAAVMWLMDQSDGKTDVLTIAEKSGRDFGLLADAAEACERAGLVKKVD
jgi:aminopeptidase-like protein